MRGFLWPEAERNRCIHGLPYASRSQQHQADDAQHPAQRAPNQIARCHAGSAATIA